MGRSATTTSALRKWASSISCFASRLYFLIIIFQLPLFRVPCSSGICLTPIQVTSSQLISSELLPVSIVKTLLYPGAIVNALVKGTNIPKYDHLLEIYNLSHDKDVPPSIDLWHLEILAGSYFSVTGAVVGLMSRGRLSLFGMLLLLWGLAKEAFRQRSSTYYLDASRTIQISPIMFVVILIALLCIKGDVKQIIRSFQAHRYATTVSILEDLIRKRRKEREMKRLEWTVNYIAPTKTRSTKIAQVGITNTF